MTRYHQPTTIVRKRVDHCLCKNNLSVVVVVVVAVAAAVDDDDADGDVDDSCNLVNNYSC